MLHPQAAKEGSWQVDRQRGATPLGLSLMPPYNELFDGGYVLVTNLAQTNLAQRAGGFCKTT